MSEIYQVGDRVRIIETGVLGHIIGPGENGYDWSIVPDGPQPWADDYNENEIERSSEPVTPAPPAQPIRPGLPGVGDALLSLAGILGAQLPDNPVVHAKLAELRSAVESAMPASTIEDGHGNGWKLCGPGCDLEVVRPGKVQCSGRVCGEAVRAL